MEKKWNLQDIKPTDRKPAAPRRTSESKQAPESDMRRRVPEPEPRSERVQKTAAAPRVKRPGNRKATILLIMGAVAILAIGFAASLVFGGAVLEVQPKQKAVTVQADFTAYAAPQAGQLGYELLTLEATGERQVTASGTEEVSEQAEGTVTIYNAYSDTTQRLIKNTRFESSDGHIFRIFESVEIPGRTAAADGTIVPGSVTARVFADAPGEEYNIGPTRFVVPGLRDTDQFDGIYAESSESFSGGFEGERYIIDDAELATVQASLHEELQQALRTRLQSERPAGFILFDDAIRFEFTTLPTAAIGENLATVKEQGKLVVPIFKEDEFASYIAENTIAGFEHEPVKIVDPTTLNWSYRGATTSDTVLSGASSIEFALSGDTRIVWQFNEDRLRTDLAGAAKTALPTILAAYPAIEKAEAIIKPFWKQSFPENKEEITLKTVAKE